MNYGLLAVTRRSRSKAPTTLEVHASVLKHCMLFILKSLPLILKFHKRVILALILVASFARPKFSSQFLRVNGILKFAKRFLEI